MIEQQPQQGRDYSYPGQSEDNQAHRVSLPRRTVALGIVALCAMAVAVVVLSASLA